MIITENMAASSLSSELLAAIQVPGLRPMPVYLSETDALTVAEFLQTHYAAYYKINVSNVHWGGEVNTNHLFDIFCSYHPQKDTVKTRFDMISFVTSNYRRYSWDCDIFLRMNKLTLNDWVNKMTYFGNCGDALAIYAMSDMYGVHSCIITKSKPWTTVANTFQGTDIDVLKLCQIKLIYLGNNRYGKLVPKDYIGQSSYVTANFNILSMTQEPAPPPSAKPQVPTLAQELETANTLLDLHESNKKDRVNKSTATPTNLPGTSDAMDQIVGYCEYSNTAVQVLKVPDTMDSITYIDQEHDNVERTVPNVEKDEPMQYGVEENVLNVETEEFEPDTDFNNKAMLKVETKKLKTCHVCGRPLEDILREEAKEDQPKPVNDLPSGEHFTRSRTRKPAIRTGRMPRKASAGIQYEESTEPTSPKKKKSTSTKPKASGPTESRVSAQNTKTPYPSRRLPPISSNGDGEDDNTPDQPLRQKSSSATKPDSAPTNHKGTFLTKTHMLRKKYTSRKYICRMCPHRSDSARDLTTHHRETHGIVYCSICKRASNNPISLRRHEYSHREKRFTCSTCSESFNFKSELNTHSIQHQHRAKHLCAFPNCGKLFKNKSDLSRHGKEHTLKAIQCPVYRDKGTPPKKGGGSSYTVTKLPSSLEPKGQRPLSLPHSP